MLTRRGMLAGTLASVGALALPVVACGAAAADTPPASPAPADAAAVPQPATAGYDLAACSANYVTRLRVSDDLGLQSFGFDPGTGDIYCAQGGANDGPDLTISRLGPDGTLIDWQVLQGGGHGTQIGVERDDQGVWIWYSWEQPVSGAPFPFRWLFTGRQQHPQPIRSDDPTVQPLVNMDGGSVQEFSIDQQSGLVVVHPPVADTDPGDTYRLRRIADVKAGADNVLAELTVPQANITYGPWQGHAAADETYLYAAYGGGRVGASWYHPPVLVRYPWAGGDPYVVELAALNLQGGARGSYVEPEGVAVYRRTPDTYEVMVGILSGGGVGWNASAYTFRQQANPEAWSSRAVATAVETPLAITDRSFTPYQRGGQLWLRCVGDSVALSGELRLMHGGYIDDETHRVVAHIPAGFLPWGLTGSALHTTVCQGSELNRFALSIDSAGDVIVWRYGPGRSVVNTWLAIYATWQR